MLDKKQIWVIFLFEFKMSHKAENTTRNINKHLAQELLMNVQCSSGSGSFAKETRALRIRSISQFSHSIVSDSLRPQGLQHARLPSPSPAPRACSNSCPSSQWCHPPSHPLLSPSPPPFNLSQHQVLFQWVSSSHRVAKVLELQHSSQLLDVDKD